MFESFIPTSYKGKMATLITFLALAIGTGAFFYAARYMGVGFTTAFLLLHLVLVGSNFLVATLYIDGVWDLFTALGYKYLNHTALPLGDGIRPSLYLLSIYTALFAGIWCVHTFQNARDATVASPAPGPEQGKKLGYLALAGIACILVYKIVAAFYLPLPVAIFIQNPSASVATLSLLIDSPEMREKLPYIFLSPIERQMSVVIFCASVLMLVAAAGLLKSRFLTAMAYTAIGLLLFADMLYLKRSPLLNIAVIFLVGSLIAQRMNNLPVRRMLRWGFVAACVCAFSVNIMYRPSVRNVLADILITHDVSLPAGKAPVVIPEMAKTLASSNNPPSSAKILINATKTLSSRILIGESLEKFYAVEHWGRAVPYAGTTFIKNYLVSITGTPQDSLGKYWYRLLRPDQVGTDVSSAQDIFLEMFMFFGPWVAYATAFVSGLLLMYLDSRRAMWCSWNGFAFYTVAMVLTAMMATKGFWSVFFAMGLLSLLLMAGCVTLLMNAGNPVGRFYARMVGRLPDFPSAFA